MVGVELAGELEGTVVVGVSAGVDVGNASLVLVVVLLDMVKRRNFSLGRSLVLINMLAILRGRSMTEVHGGDVSRLRVALRGRGAHGQAKKGDGERGDARVSNDWNRMNE